MRADIIARAAGIAQSVRYRVRHRLAPTASPVTSLDTVAALAFSGPLPGWAAVTREPDSGIAPATTEVLATSDGSRWHMRWRGAGVTGQLVRLAGGPHVGRAGSNDDELAFSRRRLRELR